MSQRLAYLCALLTICLTVYAQLVLKWQVLRHGPLPADWPDRFAYLFRMLLNPLVMSTFAAAFVASLAWILALTRLPLGHAYPLTALSYVAIVFASAAFFSESITPLKLIGLLLIVAGIVIGSQG